MPTRLIVRNVFGVFALPLLLALFVFVPSAFAAPSVTIPSSLNWVFSGTQGGVTHYANYAPGTYYVRAWAYDSAGNWSVSPSAPLQITLTAPPNAPTLSGMYQGSTYVGTTSVPAYNPNGYQLYAMATSSVSTNRYTYYFEWAPTPTSFINFATEWTQTATAPGTWSDITHFLNGNNLPGTSYVRAWTKDASTGGFSASPSPVLAVTLVVPTIQATCSVSPASAYTGAIFTWSVSNVSGGDGAYTYSWSGTDNLVGTGTYVPKSYTTAGTKTASVTIFSAGTSKTFGCGNATVSVVPDLTPTSITIPLSGSTNQNIAFSGVVSNIGTGSATNFPNVFQIYDAALTTSIASVAANTVSSLAVGASVTVSGAYSFATAGTYNVRVCANMDTSGNLLVNESNTSNNCSAWQLITVTYPPLTASCAVSPASGTVATTFLWSAGSVSGGNGVYTYSWSGTGGLTGSGATASTTYTTGGIKSAALTVTSAGGTMSKSISCTNTATVAPPPTITVNPASYVVTLPDSTISALYTLTNATAVDTSCRLLNGAGIALTAYVPCSGSQSVVAPEVAGAYGYYIQAKKNTTGEVVVSNIFVVTVNNPSVASGTLTIPASCTIAAGSSTCTVSASWTTANATGAYLYDANVNQTLYTANSSPGSTVWVANPQTIFNLKNGDGTVLATKTVTASCATGSAWSGSACVTIGYACTNLPANANAFAAPDNTGLTANTAYTYSAVGDTATKCEFNCVSGYPWNGSACGTNGTSGTLTIPASCTIAAGSSTCTVSASWTTANATGAYLYDANVNQTLYTANSSPGSTVWVANPQTIFNLKNGDGTTLDTETVTASCVAGSTWDGSICALSIYSCTNLPANANAFAAPDNTGFSPNTPYVYSSTDTLAKCEFNCANGYNWNGTSCVPNTLTVSCIGAPANPYIAQPVTWSSSVSGGSGSYTRSWSGDESLTGTTPSLQKLYASAGIKNASVTITDTVSGGTGSANCAAGVAQPNGPSVPSTGGYGVSVGACAAALSANPDTLTQGESSILSWSVTGASLCASSCVSDSVDFDTGGRISGTFSIAPPAGTPSYSLTCQAGTYGPPPPVNTTLTVRGLAPTVIVNGQTPGSGTEGGPGAVVVDPTVPLGEDNVTIEWAPPNNVCSSISICSITKNGDALWKTNLTCSGTVTDRVTTQTTYTVDCIKTNNTHVTKSIIVNVLLNYQEF